MKTINRWVLAAALVFLAVMVTSCLGGGGDGTTPEGPTRNSPWDIVQSGDRTSLNANEDRAGTQPELVEFDGKLYAAWLEQNPDGDNTQVRVAVLDPDTGAETFVDNGTLNSDADDTNAQNPHLAVYGGQLYAIWAESSAVTHSQIRVKRYNGDDSVPVWSWVAPAAESWNYSLVQDAYTPCPAVFDGSLYVAWSEDNGSGIYQIRVRAYDGATWTWADSGDATGINMAPTTETATQPALAAYGNYLYAAWTENNQIRVKATSDGTSWTSVTGGNGLNRAAAQPASFPALAEYDGKLYAAWEEVASDSLNIYQIRAASYDGDGTDTATSTWTFVDGNDDTTGLNYDTDRIASAPRLAEFDGQLYLIWEEDGGGAWQIRVRAYDGSAWTWADGGTADGLNLDPAHDAGLAQLGVFDGHIYAVWQEANGSDVWQILLAVKQEAP